MPTAEVLAGVPASSSEQSRLRRAITLGRKHCDVENNLAPVWRGAYKGQERQRGLETREGLWKAAGQKSWEGQEIEPALQRQRMLWGPSRGSWEV